MGYVRLVRRNSLNLAQSPRTTFFRITLTCQQIYPSHTEQTIDQLQGAGHDKGVRQLVAPLDASTKRSLTLIPDGPGTPLHSPPIGLKSFDDGQRCNGASLIWRWKCRNSRLAPRRSGSMNQPHCIGARVLWGGTKPAAVQSCIHRLKGPTKPPGNGSVDKCCLFCRKVLRGCLDPNSLKVNAQPRFFMSSGAPRGD